MSCYIYFIYCQLLYIPFVLVCMSVCLFALDLGCAFVLVCMSVYLLEFDLGCVFVDI